MRFYATKFVCLATVEIDLVSYKHMLNLLKNYDVNKIWTEVKIIYKESMRF